MKHIRYATMLTVVALLIGLTLGGGTVGAQTADGIPFVPAFQEPVFCYGADQFGKCRLLAGNAETCQNVEPCNWEKSAQFVPLQDPTFCYGADEFGRCQLFLGTAEMCKNVEPCNWGVTVQFLPQRDPVFCYGADESGKCQLLLGDAETCRNVEPCNWR